MTEKWLDFPRNRHAKELALLACINFFWAQVMIIGGGSVESFFGIFNLFAGVIATSMSARIDFVCDCIYLEETKKRTSDRNGNGFDS